MYIFSKIARKFRRIKNSLSLRKSDNTINRNKFTTKVLSRRNRLIKSKTVNRNKNIIYKNDFRPLKYFRKNETLFSRIEFPI